MHHSANANHCKPAGSKKKKEHHKNKEGGLFHKIKDAFSDHSSDSSSDSDNEGHKANHNKKVSFDSFILTSHIYLYIYFISGFTIIVK